MKRILSYLITAVLGAISSVLILWNAGTFSQTNAVKIYGDLSDAFFVPGVIIAGLGLLVVASNGGVFRMLQFSVIKLVDLLRRDLTKVKYRTFYDYTQAKKDKKGDYWFMLIVGTVFIVIAVVFFVIYMQKS